MILRLLILARRVREQPGVSLGLIVLLLVLSVLGNAICFYVFDGGGEDGPTFQDAVWYSVISITTIGYGDYSSSSWPARVGTVFFIVIVGLSAFTVFLGTMIDRITTMILRGQRGMSKIYAKDHVLLVNFPGESRVRQVVDELFLDERGTDRDVVIIAESIEQLPFNLPRVQFVRGSIIEKETYHRASIENATMALVLATSYEDPNSDAVVASAVSVIDSIKPEIHIVAECLSEKHRPLFRSVRCDAIVPGLRIAGNLLAQEVHDPGITQVVDHVTSNGTAETLYSALIPGSAQPMKYADLAKRLLDEDVNLLSVNRGATSHTTFGTLMVQEGDTIVYVAKTRKSTEEILGK